MTGRGGKVYDFILFTVHLLQSTSLHVQNLLSNQDFQGKNSSLLHLMETCLLAVGSMCGSLICPFAKIVHENGEETDIFLSTCFSAAAKDDFTLNRVDACEKACSALVDNSFLPSTFFGAFGQKSIYPAIRLVLAIVQNGSSNVRAKVANCGILIPSSDMMREGLSAGDRFLFSATLAITRFCGPYITASTGTDGGMNSIRHSIETMSNVLLIEENDCWKMTQLETIRALKRECIFVLDDLSTNSSLWGTIAAKSVPHISKYLLLNNAWEFGDELQKLTLCAALRCVKNIIPIPSNAVAVSRTGIGTTVSQLICGNQVTEGNDKVQNTNMNKKLLGDDVHCLSMEVLHALSTHSTARRGDNQGNLGLILSGAVDAVCYSIANNTTSPSDSQTVVSSTLVTKLGLELFQYLLFDVEEPDDSTNSLRTVFVESVSRQHNFIRTLCSTMLLTFGKNTKDSITPLYGPSLLLYEGNCLEFDNPLSAVISILFTTSAYCSLGSSAISESFWNTFLIKEDKKLVDACTKQTTAALSCAVFLNILSDEHEGICVPKNPSRREFYGKIALPTVRTRLLDGLQSNLNELFSNTCNTDESSQSLTLLQQFEVPQICLSLCRDPNCFDSAFNVVETMLCEFSHLVLPILLSDRKSFLSMLDLLHFKSENELIKTEAERVNVLAARTFGMSGNFGIIGPAVKKLDLRSEAIAFLSTACIADENELLCETDFSIATHCLHGLVGILSDPNTETTKLVSNKASDIILRIKTNMTGPEAIAISQTLGKKLSEMILSKFMKKSENEIILIEGEESIEDSNVTKSVEVMLLCALAASKDGLPEICRNGGLEALSLVGAEGNLFAIRALGEACKSNPTLVINSDGHLSVMHVITDKFMNVPTEIKIACTNFMRVMCTSKAGRVALSKSDLMGDCIKIVCDVLFKHEFDTENGDTENLLTSEKKKDSIAEQFTDKGTPINSKKSAEDKVSPKIDFVNLQLASIYLLTSLLHIKNIRSDILQNTDIKKSLNSFVQSTITDLKHAAILHLVTVAKYVDQRNGDNDGYSPDMLLMIFLNLLKSNSIERNGGIDLSSPKFVVENDTNMKRNSDQIFADLFSAIHSIIVCVPEEMFTPILSSMVFHLNRILNYKKTKKIAKIQNSGRLAFHIIFLLSRIIGKCPVSFAIIPDIVSLLIQTFLIDRSKSKEVENQNMSRPDWKKNDDYWDCALLQGLQCLHIILLQPLPKHDTFSTWAEVISSAEVIANDSNSNGNKFRSKSLISSNDSVNFSYYLTQIVEDSMQSSLSIYAEQLLEIINK
mmetsp:Transcript_13256/g.18963  ORF Transcript_13256/g.18963 Transcript_13256/m.18963 type:complete len:1296 (+) Transcript_13256:505-4392(+)